VSIPSVSGVKARHRSSWRPWIGARRLAAAARRRRWWCPHGNEHGRELGGKEGPRHCLGPPARLVLSLFGYQPISYGGNKSDLKIRISSGFKKNSGVLRFRLHLLIGSKLMPRLVRLPLPISAARWSLPAVGAIHPRLDYTFVVGAQKQFSFWKTWFYSCSHGGV
jgi:hypothetical protein